MKKIKDTENEIEKYSNRIKQVKEKMDQNTREWQQEQPGRCHFPMGFNLEEENEIKSYQKRKNELEGVLFDLKNTNSKIDTNNSSLARNKVELSNINKALKEILQKCQFLSSDINMIRDFFSENILDSAQIDDFIRTLNEIRHSFPEIEF